MSVRNSFPRIFNFHQFFYFEDCLLFEAFNQPEEIPPLGNIPRTLKALQNL
jgi:hypothetical protein